MFFRILFDMMTGAYALEICSCSYRSILNACNAGASRVELCKVLGAGGVTPSYGLIGMAAALPIRINVLIRPREGDFLYSSYEAEEILRDIDLCGRAGVNGVVIGALKADATVDEDMCRDFMKAAAHHSLSTTFHRAIDRAADISAALESVMSLGFDRVLTSGGCPTACEGMDTLAYLVRMSRTHAGSHHTIIMPGSGITPDNLPEIAQRTGACEFHLSASLKYSSGMTVHGGISEYDDSFQIHSDREIISRALKVMERL